MGRGPTGTSIRVGPSRRGKRAPQRGAQLLRRARALGGGAEAFGESHEIRIGEIAGDQPVAELLLLDAAHVAEGAVGEHDGRERNAVAHRGRHFVGREHEAAVAARSTPPARRAARPARRARWRSPSRDCPDSRARGTCAACRPGNARRAAKPTCVTSSTKMPSSGSSARMASRKASCGASFAEPLAPLRPGAPPSRRCARRAWHCAPAGTSISRRRIGLASPISAAAGLRRRPGSSGIGVDADDLEALVDAPLPELDQHAGADAQHHVGLAPTARGRAAA